MTKKHLHFMGIGGISMQGLAAWFAADGYRVSGCDIAESKSIEHLREKGIEVCIGHDAAHLEQVDSFIHTMAISESHPEVLRAKTDGIKVQKRIDLLADMFSLRRAIGVTGSHGKSTTSGMLATIFLGTGQEPSVQLGAKLPLLEGVMRYGKGEYLIAEVDESDPGFSQLTSEIAIVTNLEDDHIAGEHDERRNYHASWEDLEVAMRGFAHQANALVYCSDWQGLDNLFADHPQRHSYGFNESADYQISNIKLADASSAFTLIHAGESYRVKLDVPGKHNIQNATAALAAADLAGIALADAIKAIETFTGVGRRYQLKGHLGDVPVIDDYAVHPTEVEATLAVAKQTGRKVRAVLQPHRWVRTAQQWPALADAVSLADEILVLDIYAAGEFAIDGISVQLIIDKLRKQGKKVSHHDIASAQTYLRDSLGSNDLIITLGAGDVFKVAEGLVSSYKSKDNKTVTNKNAATSPYSKKVVKVAL